MKDVVFAMELEGQAAPVEGRDGTMAAHTTGTGPNGEAVVFKSEVVAGQGDKFTETGTIDYGGQGTIHFDTVGEGEMAASPIAGVQRGAIVWKITKADGKYAGATGYITSNFKVSAAGKVVDNHYPRIFLP